MEKTNLIYVRLGDIPATKTRKGFIKKLLTSKGVLTYLDEDCSKLQCAKKGAFRSVSELHLIVRSRFKFTSLEALLKILKEIIDEEKCVALIWCTQIHKVVVKYQENTPKEYITQYSKSNHYESKGVDGWSLKDYEEIINKL
jgi:hypothetical protein